MSITEPTTMLTDYLLAVLCLFWAFDLRRRSRASGGRSVGVWIAAFSATAVAAIAGGTAHGFRILLGDRWDAVWALTVWSIVAGGVLLIASAVRSALSPETTDEGGRRRGVRWLKRAVVVSLAGLVVLVGRLSFHRHFNHNDLYHVIQMVGLYCLYRGARALHGLSSDELEQGST